VENSVVGLLPNEDRTRNVYADAKVVTIDQIVGEPIAKPTMQAEAMAWLGEYWTTLGLGLLAAVSLLMIRSIIRAVQPSQATSGNAEIGTQPTLSQFTRDDDKSDFGAIDDEPITPRNRLRRRGVSGPSLRDELAVIVKEDPDSAVAVLKNWIGAGA
jgi:flagellar M-ring protein FliF